MQNFIASFQVTSEAQRTGPSRVHRLCLSGWQTFKFSYLCSLRTLPYRCLGREDILPRRWQEACWCLACCQYIYFICTISLTFDGCFLWIKYASTVLLYISETRVPMGAIYWDLGLLALGPLYMFLVPLFSILDLSMQKNSSYHWLTQ